MRKFITFLFLIFISILVTPSLSKAASTVAVSVTGTANCCILTYPSTASGSTSPTTNITGASTGFSSALQGVCIDPTGTYVWGADATNNKLFRFAIGGTGNIAPSVTISGLNHPNDCRFDSAGNMWVANQNGGNLLKFSAASLTSTGSPSPALTLSGGVINLPQTIGIDPSNNVWDGDFSPSSFSGAGACHNANLGAAGWATPSSNVAPSWGECDGAANSQIEGVGSNGINLVTAQNSRNGIEIWATGQQFNSGTGAWTSEISGGNTGLSGAAKIVLDPSSNIWTYNNSAIRVWNVGNQAGNVSPTKTITNAALTGGGGIDMFTPAATPQNGLTVIGQ